MMKKDGHKEGKKLSADDQARIVRLNEEIKARQAEMALIVGRYLSGRESGESYGVPVQDAGGNNVGCYDAVNGICYPLDPSGGC